MNTPLVSVITPSIRPDIISRCIELFKAQDYPNKEQIIIPAGGFIGEKRNRGCEAAKGEIIVHMDDDDYYAPDYISKAVKFLLENNADVTGLSSCYFYNEKDGKAWDWVYTDAKKAMPYVCEASMVYRKSVWQRRPFRNESNGEGLYFLAHLPRIIPHNYKDGFIAYIHGSNTASQHAIERFKPISVDVVLNILNLHKDA